MGRFAFNVTLSIPLDVEVEVVGFSSPAVTSGPPDSWRAPEYEDERRVVGASIAGVGLPEDILKRLVQFLRPAVEAEDVDPPREYADED